MYDLSNNGTGLNKQKSIKNVQGGKSSGRKRLFDEKDISTLFVIKKCFESDN